MSDRQYLSLIACSLGALVFTDLLRATRPRFQCLGTWFALDEETYAPGSELLRLFSYFGLSVALCGLASRR